MKIIDAEVRKSIPAAIEQSSGSAKDLELKIRKANGELMDIFNSVEKIEIDNKICYATAFVDITDRKKAEAEIKKRNETLEQRVAEKTKEVIEKEQQYRFLLQNMQEGIQVISRDWRYLFVNNSVVKQSKYLREELLGHTMMEKYPGIENTELFKILQRCMNDRVPHSFVNEFTFPDKTKGWFELSIQPVPEGLLILSIDITERIKLEKNLAEQKLVQQKMLTEFTIQAQEKERHELGRELHDNINQILATAKMYLGIAKSKAQLPLELVTQSYEYVNEAIEEIRKLSHSLVAPSLGDVGLHEALLELAEEINFTKELRITVENNMNNELPFDDKKELMLYRIVQEQLNNIRKYAQAKTATIQLETMANELYLTITDNGVGFDTSARANGIGLKNIQSRVEFYNGKMNIISSPGNGCILEVSIPL